MLIRILDSDPEFTEPFRAYANYFEDLAEEIRRRYGSESTVSGVGAATRILPNSTRIQRRSLSSSERDALELSLRKSWGTLRRLDREVSDEDEYDEEVNAWIPIQAYYSTYHAILALAAASNQAKPKDHAAALKQAGSYVTRGVLPPPWDTYCTGCPQTGSVQFNRLNPTRDGVHVLSSPGPESFDDRLAMFLRTTRAKELDRRFRQERLKGRASGRSRRNLREGDKEQIAESMSPTTVFDLLWRIRKKANYEDADAFVLGASSEYEARRFGEALVTLVDGTVAALEALMAAHVGRTVIADLVSAYAERTAPRVTSAMTQRAAVLAWQVGGCTGVRMDAASVEVAGSPPLRQGAEGRGRWRIQRRRNNWAVRKVPSGSDELRHSSRSDRHGGQLSKASHQAPRTRRRRS